MKKIRLGEIKTVVNDKRKFGSNVNYYASYIKLKGDTCSVLFTLDELKVAINRSRINPEDLPGLAVVKPFNWAIVGFILGLVLGCLIAFL